MSTPWLADVLRAAGLTVVEHHVPGRPVTRTQRYAPIGVLLHHTATTTSDDDPIRSLNLVKRGRLAAGPNYLPGPLCQVLIGYDGTCQVITTGRANHAGAARQSGPIPAGDGNELLIGLELDYDGVQQPSPAQVDAAVVASRAICGRLGVDADHVRGHRETSVTGKPDPQHIDLDAFRARVANPEEDDMAGYNRTEVVGGINTISAQLTNLTRGVLTLLARDPDIDEKALAAELLPAVKGAVVQAVRDAVLEDDDTPDLTEAEIDAAVEGAMRRVLGGLDETAKAGA